MICLFHNWIYSEYRAIEKDGISSGWYKKRICKKCGKIQSNIPDVLYSRWSSNLPIEDIKIKNEWVTIGYLKSGSEISDEVNR